MKTITKYFVMMVVMMTMCVNFSSCEKDEAVEGLNDYYVEFNVSGGGLDASELSALKALLNYEFSEVVLEALEKDEAIYIFDRLVKELKYEFSGGMEIDEPLKITLYLKTTDGKLVKKSVLTISDDGCTIS